MDYNLDLVDKELDLSLRSARRSVGWRAYAASLAASAGLVALATLAGLPLRPYVNPTNLVMLYFVAVMVTAIWLGRGPAIFASVTSVLVFDIFFVPPYYTLAIDDAEYVLAFAGLLGVSLVISTLAARAREQELAARSREAQTAALYELNQELAAGVELSRIAQTAVRYARTTLGCEAALYIAHGDPGMENQSLSRLLAATPGFQPEADARTAADWVYRHNQPAGRHMGALTPAKETYFPLRTSGGVIGVLSLDFAEQDIQLTADQRRFLASYASQVALALERAQLAETARQTRLLEETERLQTALLNSISHDLRTPLATITGALSSLLEDAQLLSETARTELVLTAWEESVRLNRLVGNLLNMTRLQSGAMKMVRQTNDVEDLVGAALAQMPRRLRGRDVKSTIPRELPPVDVDLALAVQALVNLLDNALKFAPADQPIEIEAYEEDEWVIVSVKDRGPGLPQGDSELLFDKFFRGPGSYASGGAQVGGTGLGLSIAKGIVEAHGGCIWAKNRPTGGAVFSFSLPVAAVGSEHLIEN